MSKIYRFKRAIKLDDGTWIGNNDPSIGPLGGEAFFDKDEDNEIQNKVKEQCAKEAAAIEAVKAVKPKK